MSIKFIEKKNLWFFISLLFIAIGFSMIAYRALKSEPVLDFGIDFVGGSTFILKSEALDKSHLSKNQADIEKINLNFIQELRQILNNLGIEKANIQITQDKEVLIKTTQMESDESVKLLAQLRDKLGGIEVLEIDFIGPTIGAELREISLWIIFIVSIALLLYITWRFEFTFGLAALGALLHDALIVISFAAIFNIEVTVAFVAALLTVLGYSINDTIVIFDRIREDISLYRKKHFSMANIANIAINQTLIRTINTSATTLAVIASLLVFGGVTIKDFCLVLLIGILSGTYSSIFIASPLLVVLHPSTEKNK
ncbi:protein translocase subunit SecF [Candidatus Margulisiibacteriota bacterium]